MSLEPAILRGPAARAAARRRRRARVIRQRLAAGTLLLAGIGFAAWELYPFRGPTSFEVRIGGHQALLPPKATLADAIVRFHLHPRAGNLLDVEGVPLRAGAYPGRIAVNGAVVPPATRLRAGDGIVVVDGTDRVEGTERKWIKASAAVNPSPQFFLDTVPGRYLVVRGKLSHELVSARFQQTGGPRATRQVALTFDDGPWPDSTAKILAILKRLHAPATFFVIGRQVPAFPSLVRAEVAAGMSVGNHTWSHPYRHPFANLPAPDLNLEMTRTVAALAHLGIDADLFRPPGGSDSDRVVAAARSHGMRVILWSVDSRDWAPHTTASQLVRRVLAAVRPGSIVILHDGGGNRSATVAALPAIITGIRARGLELVRLGRGPRTG